MTSPAPQQLPTSGGSYLRNADGSLTLVEQTSAAPTATALQEPEPEPAAAPAAKPVKKET